MLVARRTAPHSKQRKIRLQMKKLLFFTIVLSLVFTSCKSKKQIVPADFILRKDGCIEIKKIEHFVLENKWGEPTKKISNRAKRPYLLIYLDSLGNVIEKIGYGKYHNTDLRLLDFVEQNIFENGRLTSTIKYKTDYCKNINADFKTIYSYNSANQLIQEKVLYFETDSLFMQFDYEYDTNGNNTKTIIIAKSSFNPTYYKRTFDSQSRLQSLQQIYDSNLRWEWTYTYTDTTRIGDFRTYYNNGKDYTKQEIRTYQNGKLTGIEERYTSRDGLSEKTIFHYDQHGLINKIDFFHMFGNDYVLRKYREVKVEYCIELTPILIEEINEIIYDE